MIIASIFILAVNFAVAADDNVTQEISKTDDDVVSVGGVSGDELEISEENALEAPTNSQNIGDAHQTIKMDKVTKRYNGIIQYRAFFYNNDGTPLSNTNVIFEVDDYNDYDVKTDDKGIALLTIKIGNGNHKIAALNPTNLNVSYDNIKVFDVIKGGKNINMYYDGGNVYKVRVFDDNGNPVKAGEKVKFAIGKKVYVKKTDKKGYAVLKITSKPGAYEIGARYKDFVVKNILYVNQVLKPLTSFSGRAVKSTINYKVKFLGKNKKNKKITVRFNKKVYKAKTNKKGIATFKLKTPKKVGKYNVVTSYKKTKITSVYSKYYA